VTAVVRTDARMLAASSEQDVALLGVPPLGPSWMRADFARERIGALVGRLAPIGGYALAGDPLPRGARRLSLPLTIRGSALSLTIVAQLADGTFELPTVGRNVGPGSLLLRARVPTTWRRARVLISTAHRRVHLRSGRAESSAERQPTPAPPTR
jgi:hypothetical protein